MAHLLILGLKRLHTLAEQDLPSRVRDQVRTEIRTLIEEGGEVSDILLPMLPWLIPTFPVQLSPIIGKRKRGNDESLDTPVAGNIPATSVSRPRKRLRVVADVAAAGALGALGAWLGLAFL